MHVWRDLDKVNSPAITLVSDMSKQFIPDPQRGVCLCMTSQASKKKELGTFFVNVVDRRASVKSR